MTSFNLKFFAVAIFCVSAVSVSAQHKVSGVASIDPVSKDKPHRRKPSNKIQFSDEMPKAQFPEPKLGDSFYSDEKSKFQAPAAQAPVTQPRPAAAPSDTRSSNSALAPTIAPAPAPAEKRTVASDPACSNGANWCEKKNKVSQFVWTGLSCTETGYGSFPSYVNRESTGPSVGIVDVGEYRYPQESCGPNNLGEAAMYVGNKINCVDLGNEESFRVACLNNQKGVPAKTLAAIPIEIYQWAKVAKLREGGCGYDTPGEYNEVGTTPPPKCEKNTLGIFTKDRGGCFQWQCSRTVPDQNGPYESSYRAVAASAAENEAFDKSLNKQIEQQKTEAQQASSQSGESSVGARGNQESEVSNTNQASQAGEAKPPVLKSCPAGKIDVRSRPNNQDSTNICSFSWAEATVGQTGVMTGATNGGTISATCGANGEWQNVKYTCPAPAFEGY